MLKEFDIRIKSTFLSQSPREESSLIAVVSTMAILLVSLLCWRDPQLFRLLAAVPHQVMVEHEYWRLLTAIGVHVGRGITTHGLALNVQPDLSAYQRFVPCGLAFHGVTSMAQIIDEPPSVVDMASHVANQLATLLECKLVVASDP